MLTHKQIWDAIDDLAKDHGLSPSGLAKKAGLDTTSFNKSKRINASGRPRWPSMESVAKILVATDESVVTFATRMTVRVT
jgi:phage repressor protein C with HTH and peptisase S24 domain